MNQSKSVKFLRIRKTGYYWYRYSYIKKNFKKLTAKIFFKSNHSWLFYHGSHTLFGEPLQSVYFSKVPLINYCRKKKLSQMGHNPVNWNEFSPGIR